MQIAQVLLCLAASCLAAEPAVAQPVVAQPAVAQPAADETPDAKIDSYLSSMLAERQKLRSGDFVVSGTKSFQSAGKPEADYSGRVLISGAFDEDRIRMDNLEPGSIWELPLAQPPKLKPGRIERMYFRTPERSVTWIPGNWSHQIVIAKPETMLGQFLFFDVRGLGFTTWTQVADKPGVKVETAIAGWKRTIRQRALDASDPKFVQLIFTLELATRSEELRYWLRPDQGFAPTRLEAKTRQLDVADADWQVIERAETSWEQQDDVWLPVRFDMTSTRGGNEQKLAWKIRWRSVNKPIDNKRFEWEDFGAPETVEVVDMRGMAPVVLRAAPEK